MTESCSTFQAKLRDDTGHKNIAYALWKLGMPLSEQRVISLLSGARKQTSTGRFAWRCQSKGLPSTLIHVTTICVIYRNTFDRAVKEHMHAAADIHLSVGMMLGARAAISNSLLKAAV